MGAMALRPLTQLISLDLSNSMVTDEGICAVVDAVPSLIALRLNDCRALSDVAVEAIGRLSRVELLWLGGLFNQVSDHGLGMIGQMTSLDDLHLAVTNCTPLGLQQLASLSRLSALTLERTHGSLHDISGWNMLATNFPSLVHLQVMDTHVDVPYVVLILLLALFSRALCQISLSRVRF